MNYITSPVSNIVTELQSLGIYLWVEEQQLRFKAPVGALTEEMRQAISQRKQVFIDHLSAPQEQERIPSDPENQHEPFPLTDLQVAYIVGRRSNYELGGVGCHSYIELELPRLDALRLQEAWHKLILRHDMLRAVIGTDGQQKVLKNVTLPPVRTKDLAGQPMSAFEQAVQQVRDEMAFRCYDSERWPLYELRLTQHDDHAVLHHSTDLLIADFASIQILLAELGDLYDHPDKKYPPLAVTFRDILLAKNNNGANKNSEQQARYQQHKDYWMARVATLPGAPELPVVQSQPSSPAASNGEPTFLRFSLSLDKPQWQSFCQLAAEFKVTPSSVVMNAFTEVLQRWSRHADFCINLTLLNRPSTHQDIQRVVGDFIAVNVLEVQDSRGDNFLERAQALQQQLWQDMAHGDFTGIEVLREITRQQQSNVLIPVVFTSTVGVSGSNLPQNAFMHNAKLKYGITQTPQVWLDCQATERRNELHIDWDVRIGVFQPEVIEQAFDAFKQLLENLATCRQSWLQHRPVTLPASTIKQRNRLNREKTAPLPDGYLHQSFCEKVLQQPDQPALKCGFDTWSYRQLAAWSLTIADQLKLAGCTQGQPVALYLDKGPAQIAAIMGVLLAEGAYVPIDITQPEKRRSTIIRDSGAELVITEPDFSMLSWPDKTASLILDADLLELSEQWQPAAIESAMETIIAAGKNADTASQLAYILYTSGTTGHPKGVMLSHQGVANTIIGFNQQFGITASDRTLALVNYSFDLSVLDVFCTFTAGATLILPDSNWRNDPSCWARTIQQHKATIWNSVPAHMQMLMAWHENYFECDISSLRLAFISGDWIPVTLPVQIHQRLPQLSLNSLGGPTEISVTCIFNPIVKVSDNATSIPYGTPLSNHTIYIQNSHFEDCPDWTPGEMLVGGPGVALGFANDPERTSQRFIIHPHTGERLYRTGDICRYRPDGVIEILGREDNQIKIRGHRIELGEVEAALNDHPYIKQAVALTRPDPIDLVAAVVPTRDHSATEESLTAQILQDLEHSLPGYMIPATLKLMTEIPLSANGKVDRKALKDVFINQQASHTAHEPPKNNWLEQTLAAIWCELTQVENISRDDDFFMIGGSSLTAVGLLNRLTEERFAVNIDLIFNNSVFSDMVDALQKTEDKEENFRQSIDLNTLADHALRNIATARPYQSQADSLMAQKVFMTGATGYLGIYILKATLDQTADTIYCLIRCNDEEDGYFRLQQLADEKGLALNIDRDRIKVIPGDLTADRFGIDDKTYQWLAENTDKVLHIAALISLIAPLSSLYPINVKGSANVIELASTSRIKPIHYMSTIGVHYRLPYHENEPPIPEATSPVEPWHKPELTYEHTKYMAEQLFYIARERQIPVNIFRSGAITWDNTQQQPFINDDAFVKFFRTCLSISAYPESRILISTTPVNVVARYIAMISHRAIIDSGKNFHVVSRHSHTGDQIYQWLNELGCHFNKLDFAQWDLRLADSFGRGFINRYFKHGMEQGGHHQYRIDNLEAILTENGEAPYKVEKAYFKPMITHFMKAIEQAGTANQIAPQAAPQSQVPTATEDAS